MIGLDDLKREVKANPYKYLKNHFPNGKLDGEEFLLGDITGAPGKILQFHIKKQTWKDYAVDNFSGQGFISLYAAHHGILSISEAWIKLAGDEASSRETEAPKRPVNRNQVEDAFAEAGTSIAEIQDNMFPPPTVEADDGITRTRAGVPHGNYNNVYRTIGAYFHGNFWWDEYEQNIMTNLRTNEPVQLTPEKCDHLVGILQGRGYPRLSHSVVEKAIKAFAKSDRTPRRNRELSRLKALKWDRTVRLPTFLAEYMGAHDNKFVETVSQNFFISIVARIVCPGAKSDNMLILEGRQGIGKGQALEAIAGEERFAEESGRFDNEMIVRMIGKSLIEFSELATVTSRNFENFKSYLTRRTDNVRRLWQKNSERIKRTAVWVGTTNRKTYIHDATGGHRFWPVQVRKINVQGIRNIRDQLFAEAYQLYQDGATWWDVPQELAEIEQRKRRVIDPWEDKLRMYLQNERAYSRDLTDVRELAIACLHLDNRDLNERTSTRIEKILETIGYEKEFDGIGLSKYRFVDTY